ncbi:hypothetical protein K432DRAFT_389408 [Lepidopterella palustris CBS 459.81]|uniref:DUF7025 domain-containing protein n=1 Tax=Lepidopterella palustris CBS 459.81 TaxID=1314670 RepID=A0A8E2JJ59_9PEZI|nr:hypothetical protein K432DRAFT_389408 [Lepidopterella palustris CBS 459.81]
MISMRSQSSFSENDINRGLPLAPQSEGTSEEVPQKISQDRQLSATDDDDDDGQSPDQNDHSNSNIDVSVCAGGSFRRSDSIIEHAEKGSENHSASNHAIETSSNILLMVERIAYLEDRVRQLKRKSRENGSSSDDEPDAQSNEREAVVDSRSDGLILELNRKLEEDIEEEKQYDKFKEKAVKIRNRKRRRRKFVIDVVEDKGDYVTPTQSLGAIQECPVPGRIRISSRLIINTLNEFFNLALREPCIMIHPFKVLVDNEETIRRHLEVLQSTFNESQPPWRRASEPPRPRPDHSIPKHAVDDKRSLGKCSSDNVQSAEKSSSRALIERENVNHFLCLLELMDHDLKSEIAVVRAIKDGSARTIIFSHLWHLFPPGEIIYCPNISTEQQPQAYKVLYWFFLEELDVRYAGKGFPFHIDCMYLDFDGKHFRPVQFEFSIAAFTGDVEITCLQVYPLRFLQESLKKRIHTELFTRGRTFFQLAKKEATHMEYFGLTLDPKDKEELAVLGRKIRIRSKEKADNAVFEGSQGRPRMKETQLFGLGFYSTTDIRKVVEVIEDKEPDPSYFNDTLYYRERSDRLVNVSVVLKPLAYEMDSKDLTHDDIILLPGNVYAYVLRYRKFCKCDVNLIKDVNLSKNGFDELVLPVRTWELIKSLVDTHTRGPRPVDKKAEDASA